MLWRAPLDTFGTTTMHWAATKAIQCIRYAHTGLRITHPTSHYINIAVEHSNFTFKLSKMCDVCYVYRPTNQDQEQTMMMQRGFKGSQRPSVTTWTMLPGVGGSSPLLTIPSNSSHCQPTCLSHGTHTQVWQEWCRG